jgi:hypothetical protein
MNNLLAATICLAGIAIATPAHAGRPLQTEDAGVIDRGNCEVEGAALRTTTLGERSTEQGLGLACGVGANSQLGLGASSVREGGVSARGVSLGGKTGLWKGEGDEAAALTLAWGLGWARVDNNWKHAATDLNLVLSQPLAGNTLHLNLGHTRDVQGREVSTTWNVALEHPGFEVGGINLAPMAELFGDDRTSAWWNVGLRATVIPEKVFFDVSYGRQTRGDKPTLVTAGFKFAF